MSAEWQTPEQNPFESFIARTTSNRTPPKQTSKSLPSSPSKHVNTSPMPKPKTKSEFVAWGEYIGTGKDKDLVAWKKRQIGEEDQTHKSEMDIRQTANATPSDKDKENKRRSRSAGASKKNAKESKA
jgi:hypothetical protein